MAAMRCLRPLSVLLSAAALFPPSCESSSLLAGSSTGSGGSGTNFIRQSDLPANNGNWISIRPNVEFLPATATATAAPAPDGTTGTSTTTTLDGKMDGPIDAALRRQLEQQSSSSAGGGVESPYDTQPFVNGESEYDEYQQAWRFLGFMIDCNEGNNDDDDGSGDSWDGGTGEGCHRYVLWAAYVDLDYEGGGIGEYQYWNRETESWDATSCNYGGGGGGGGSQDNGGGDGGSSRCAKMDCHLENTHWSLLGLFKHRGYDDWMEQLFKHEGYCVWTDEEYAFMKDARKAWPRGCSYSASADTDGGPIYYDLKPTSGGGMTIGLYTDVQCTEDYRGTITVEDVLGNVLAEASGSGSQDNYNYDFSAYSLEESLSKWETTFDTWKICHPCVAYDLNNVGYNVDDDASRGSAYNAYDYGYDDDYNNNNNYEQQDDFDCYDDADYTNVNQCMKFMAKTDMASATLRDVSLASVQGTLVKNIPLEGYRNVSRSKRTKQHWITGVFFVFSAGVLTLGVFMFQTVRREIRNIPKFLKEPLGGGVVS